MTTTSSRICSVLMLIVLCGTAAPSHAQTCEGVRETRKTASGHLVKGDVLKALYVIRSAGQEHCPAMRHFRAQIYSQVGDYPRADAIAGAFRARDRVNCAKPASGAQVHDWRAKLQDRLEDAQIVILNEAHHRPEHRAFAILLAEHLRRKGFRYLAIEDATPATPKIQARGWIEYGENGGEMTEPVFAQLVERGIELGYTLVNYEWITNLQPGTGDPRHDEERIQAENLVARTLAQDPNAKILVFVGWGHAREDLPPDRPVEKFLAGWLRELSGIDPLTIAQTVCPQINRRPRDSASPFFILSNPEDKASGYDVIVRGTAPANEPEAAWPHWFRSIGRHRIANDLWLPQGVLEEHADDLLMIEARLAGRPERAVPNDRILVENGVPVRDLALLPGTYVVVLNDADGATIRSRTIEISKDGAGTAKNSSAE